VESELFTRASACVTGGTRTKGPFGNRTTKPPPAKGSIIETIRRGRSAAMLPITLKKKQSLIEP
jgi:hypothetical protein